MSPDQQYAAASAAVAAILIITGWLFHRFVISRSITTTPERRCYKPRHGHSGQERMPSLDELARWREDWTDAELAVLRRDDGTIRDNHLAASALDIHAQHSTAARWPGQLRSRDFHAWQIEQEQWLEARRREAHEYALALKTGAWADPWWIYR